MSPMRLRRDAGAVANESTAPATVSGGKQPSHVPYAPDTFENVRAVGAQIDLQLRETHRTAAQIVATIAVMPMIPRT